MDPAVDFLARVDASERVGVLIERMTAPRRGAPIADADAAGAQLVELFRDDDPEPPTPAAPANVVPFPARTPFDRASHCQAIAAGGGARTVALYGTQHMRAIGEAGARATIRRHGFDTFAGIVKAKGWDGPRRPDVRVDLAIGEYLAA